MKKLRVLSFGLLLLILTTQSIALLGPFAVLVVRMGGTAAMSEYLVMSTVTIGSMIAFVNVSKPDFSTPNLTVQLAPDAPLPAGAGWTASTGGAGSGGKPTPPSSAGATHDRFWNMLINAYGLDTLQEYCDTGRAFQDGINPGAQVPYSITSCTKPSGTTSRVELLGAQGHVYSYQNSVIQGCSGGYTSSGGNCTLSNAAVVQKPADGTCNIVRSGNSYAIDPLDNADCAGQTAVSINGGTVTINALNGDVATAFIDPGTLGQTITLKSYDPAAGVTTIKTVAVSVPAASSNGTGQTGTTVLGIGSSQQSGAGTLAGPLPGESGEGSDPCGAPGQPVCSVKIDETGLPASTDADAIIAGKKTEYDEAVAVHLAEIGKIAGASQVTDTGLGLSVPLPSVGCTDPTFSMPNSGGRSLTVPLCARAADIKAALSFVVAMLTAIYLFHLGAGLFSRI